MEASSAAAAEVNGGSPSIGKRLLDLGFAALPAIGGAVGFVGFIAVLGGAIQWVRFDAAQLPAAQAVHAIPRGELVAIGAQSLILFTLLGLLAVILVYIADPRGEGNLATARALLVVTVLECIAVVALVGESAAALVGSAFLVVGLAVLAGLVISPVLKLFQQWTAVTRLRAARQRWEEAAQSARIERTLASRPALASMSSQQAEAARQRRATAERRLIEAEAAWARLLEQLDDLPLSEPETP